jgi:hypothetical protein
MELARVDLNALKAEIARREKSEENSQRKASSLESPPSQDEDEDGDGDSKMEERTGTISAQKLVSLQTFVCLVCRSADGFFEPQEGTDILLYNSTLPSCPIRLKCCLFQRMRRKRSDRFTKRTQKSTRRCS